MALRNYQSQTGRELMFWNKLSGKNKDSWTFRVFFLPQAMARILQLCPLYMGIQKAFVSSEYKDTTKELMD